MEKNSETSSYLRPSFFDTFTIRTKRISSDQKQKNNSTTRLFVAADKSRTFTVLSSSFENISQLSVGFGERIEMQYNYDGHVKWLCIFFSFR